MLYDDEAWHREDDFPVSLPPEAAGTHIGMFLAWAVGRGLLDGAWVEARSAGLERLRAGTLTGTGLLRETCGGTLAEEDLGEEGRRFADAYYGDRYFDDYLSLFAEGPYVTPYEVEDNAENAARVAALLDRRFEAWRKRAAAG